MPKSLKWLSVCLGNIAKPSRFLGGTLKGKRWKTRKTPINIDGVEYHYDDMTPEQQTAVNHLVDLDRKLNSARFALTNSKLDATLSWLC
jgi:hypothetical protein